MKSGQSLLFFCSVLAGLVLLCICFPHDGLPLAGNTRLRFPTLKEAMEKTNGSHRQEEEEEADTVQEAPEQPDLSPEELLQMRQDALNAQQIGC